MRKFEALLVPWATAGFLMASSPADVRMPGMTTIETQGFPVAPTVYELKEEKNRRDSEGPLRSESKGFRESRVEPPPEEYSVSFRFPIEIEPNLDGRFIIQDDGTRRWVRAAASQGKSYNMAVLPLN